MLSDRPPLPLGTETPEGVVQAVGITGGERYYWLVDAHGVVSMMPWFMVETTNDDRESEGVNP
jgi:hypothetical protein